MKLSDKCELNPALILLPEADHITTKLTALLFITDGKISAGFNSASDLCFHLRQKRVFTVDRLRWTNPPKPTFYELLFIAKVGTSFHKLRPHLSMAKIIAICNQKGGVGKTTTAINLGYYLAHKGRRVLLIDFDPQANATSGLGVDKSKLTQGIYDVLINNVQAQEIVQDVHLPEFRLIPSSISLTGAEIELISLMNREYRLKNALKGIEKDYDFILIDSPPSLGLLTINTLTAATSVLIPIQCEYYALEGLSQLLNTINIVHDNLNPDLTIEGVLLTMADYRTNLTSEVIGESRQFFKERVFKTIIPRSIKLSEAPGFGKPIHVYDKNSIGAKMYSSLASEILSEPISEDISYGAKEMREAT